ncbi:MAG: hypothetical protein FJ308_00095 [Planctomycetes bacterium]|nr:hypothetical protein [Planctomycetota bacterium]
MRILSARRNGYLVALGRAVFGMTIALGAWSGFPQIAVAGNPWSSAIGEAIAVQGRTEDILERVHQKYPRSFVAQPAATLDNSACRLVELLKTGAHCDQVRFGFEQTHQLWRHVAAMMESDCHMRNDRTMRSYMESLDRRMARMAIAVQHAMKRTPVPVPIPFAFDAPHSPYESPLFPQQVFPQQVFPQQVFPQSMPPFQNAWGDRRSY